MALDTSSLPPEAVELAKTEAKKEALYAGLTAALASALVGAKAFRLGRYQTIASAVLTGVLSGYYFNQGFASLHLAQLRQEMSEKNQKDAAQVSESESSSSL